MAHQLMAQTSTQFHPHLWMKKQGFSQNSQTLKGADNVYVFKTMPEYATNQKM